MARMVNKGWCSGKWCSSTPSSHLWADWWSTGPFTSLENSRSFWTIGIDVSGWRCLLSYFYKESTDLCEAIAMLGRCICQNFVDPDGLSAYTSYRLVPMDKCPGLRPIGIGEVVRRIIGKAILTVTSQDIQQVTGALQLCAGQQSGCELTIESPPN